MRLGESRPGNANIYKLTPYVGEGLAPRFSLLDDPIQADRWIGRPPQLVQPRLEASPRGSGRQQEKVAPIRLAARDLRLQPADAGGFGSRTGPASGRSTTKGPSPSPRAAKSNVSPYIRSCQSE